MSTPQLEDGYVRIANELLDAILAFDFSKRELNVVFAVIRKTYGYQKKTDAVSGWQLSQMTGMDRGHISRTVADLVERGVLIESGETRFSHGQHIPAIGINKRFTEWKTSNKTSPVPKRHPCQNSNSTVAETAKRPLPKKQPQKTTTKDKPKDIAPRARNLIWDAVLEVCGLTGSTPTQSERGGWNKAVKELRDIGATPDEIHQRARIYRKTWPNVSLTPNALSRRWNECAAKPAPDAPAAPKTIDTMSESELVQRCRDLGINDSGMGVFEMRRAIKQKEAA